jgi:uncharacterized protein (DUF2141 family)
MRIFRITLLLTVWSISGKLLCAQILDIQIKNIHNTSGQLCIVVFASQTEFKTGKPFWSTKCQKNILSNGAFHIKIPIQRGKYGVSILDDENGRMDYNLFGIHREGFGFSYFYQKGIKMPVFSDFSFFIEKQEIKLVTILMKYF